MFSQNSKQLFENMLGKKKNKQGMASVHAEWLGFDDLDVF